MTLDALVSVSVKTTNNAYYKSRQATQVREKSQNVVGKHERAARVELSRFVFYEDCFLGTSFIAIQGRG